MSDVRILVVEDEHIVARHIQSKLRELGYVVVGMADSGEVAIDLAAKLQPDLVVMDILLKGEMDGIQAAAQIQARFGTPVIYLTSYSDEAVLQRAKLTDPLGFVIKPFEPSDLYTAIELALYRHAMKAEIREMNANLERRVAEHTAQLAAANEMLRQSEATFRHIYESVPVMICSLDQSDVIVNVNRKWLEETGYSREEVVGRRHDSFMTPESSERAFMVSSQFERDGFVHDVPYQYIQKSGAVIDVLFDCQLITTPAGRWNGLAVVRNVTEQRWSERRLRLQSAALESAANAIVITNPHGRIEWANTAFTQLSGYSLEEVVNQPLPILSSGQQDEAFQRQLWETIKAGRVWRGELVNQRKDGSLYVEEQTITPVLDEYAEIAHFVAIKNLKPGDQKDVQVRLMHVDRLSAVGQLTPSVAHELNNPLQAVIGCLTLAQEALAAGGEDAGEYLQVACEEVRRIARIVARMRDFYRPEADERELAEVNPLVEHVLDLSRKRCQEGQVLLEWIPAEGLPALVLSPDQIKQVFLNLLLNAVDAMPDGGRLEVGTVYTPDPPGVRITFCDNGVGISPEVLPHIFETFYSPKPEGSGLGLAISFDIVSAHSGRLDVQSQVGEGSTFTVWLPAGD